VFYGAYRQDGHGRAAYEPARMVALVLYAYARGVRSSRAIERACEGDVAYRVIAAQQKPDHAIGSPRLPTSAAATGSLHRRTEIPSDIPVAEPKFGIAHERQVGTSAPTRHECAPATKPRRGRGRPLSRRSDVQDSTHADGVPVVALTADERDALRNHIAMTLLLAKDDLEDAYLAVELARPEAIDRVSKALVDIRLATDALERDFGWDPTAEAFLQLDEAGCELLDRAVAQARGCLPPSEQDHPDDVRGWVALVALGDRVGDVM
jgi:hypothetical protein